MARLTLFITPEMAAALVAMADTERRTPQAQAACLLEQALAAWQTRSPLAGLEVKHGPVR